LESKHNRTCVICGKSYRACKSCQDAQAQGQMRWRMSCDVISCFQVLLVLSDFYYGKISKEEARSLMDGLLLDVPPPYVPEAQVILDKIYEEETMVDSLNHEIEQESEVITIEEEKDITICESPATDEDLLYINETDIPFSELQNAEDDQLSDDYSIEPQQDEFMK
jgi:hypothetical protein